MRKPTSKVKAKPPNKDKFTATEVGSLIEHFRGEFKLFGERQDSMVDKLDATYEQVGKNTEKIALLETAVRNITKDVALLNETVKNMVAKIEALTKSINELIKTKADREDILSLEKRVGILETKVASLSR